MRKPTVRAWQPMAQAVLYKLSRLLSSCCLLARALPEPIPIKPIFYASQSIIPHNWSEAPILPNLLNVIINGDVTGPRATSSSLQCGYQRLELCTSAWASLVFDLTAASSLSVGCTWALDFHYPRLQLIYHHYVPSIIPDSSLWRFALCVPLAHRLSQAHTDYLAPWFELEGGYTIPFGLFDIGFVIPIQAFVPRLHERDTIFECVSETNLVSQNVCCLGPLRAVVQAYIEVKSAIFLNHFQVIARFHRLGLPHLAIDAHPHTNLSRRRSCRSASRAHSHLPQMLKPMQIMYARKKPVSPIDQAAPS